MRQRLGAQLRADTRAAGRALTLGAGQVMGSGSCAGCPQGHPGGGKLGLEHLKMQEEERGATGAAARPLFGEARRYELPWAVDPRQGKRAQAS